MADVQSFCNRLDRGPAVLLLGQAYLKLETGVDPLLVEIKSKYNGAIASGPDYDLILEGAEQQSSDVKLGWITERSRRLTPPEWLRYIASYRWSSVYSSSIHPIWLSAFRTTWRDVAPIYEEEYFPRDPRNRRVLHRHGPS